MENWKEEFDKLVRSKLNENAFEARGSLAEFLRSTSKQFGVDKGYMQSVYYSIKRDWEKDGSHSQGVQQEQQPPESVTVEVGDVIEGEVVGIQSWGAFVSLPNGADGVVHISNIMEAFVHNVSRHFKVGDKVKADVIKVENKDGQTRYDLSTKRYAHLLPDYDKKAEAKQKTTFKLDELQNNEGLARQLKERFSLLVEPAASEVVATVEVTAPQQQFAAEEAKEQDTKTEEREAMLTTTTTSNYNEKEFQRIEEWVNKTIHTPLSPEARTKLVELVEKHSMFDVCMAMFDTDFKVDLGLLFAEKIEKKLDGGGL